MKFVRNPRVVRAALLASVAGMTLGFTGTAFAQDTAGPRLSLSEAEREAQGGSTSYVDPDQTQREAYSYVTSGPDIAPAPEIVIANPGTPTTARDPVNVTGVGQMIVDEQTGFISLCTGTLINPRTVIFAAHCVNERAANLYGQNSGGQPIGFGFSNSNNTAGASAFGTWLNGSATLTGGQKYATIPSLFMYDANYVAYNPLSNEANAAGFLYADIALASLDTPAANVPTWALMFSQLPAVPITAAGTGYHVTIDGYGNNGTATTGSTGGIDYRRRIAENTLGALASLGDFEQFLFGPTGTSDTTNPQNLYWIDFDDPRRGQSGVSAFDFNAWRDNATPNEGITASGDSGGPLILDKTYAKQLVIGVLSGGYTRFFNGQPANGYGTAAFYQPLYLYWDWIAANNPYHYVTNVAGNRNWTDNANWVSTLDPNYYSLVNGQLVNAVPTNPGTGNTNTPGFGQACFQSGGVSDCYDVATGTETVRTAPIGTATNDPASVDATDLAGIAANDAATVSAATLGEGGASAQIFKIEDATPQAVAQALPVATLANGLPGATGFSPNNFDGNRLTNTAPRYFDVTLAAAGTTTLNTAATVDRFTLAGGSAMLDIAVGGALTSLMSITQSTGTMQVNGALTTPGDYLMMSGGLNGTGTITTPFFTSIAGTIAPATAGTVGTLTFKGNVILASGSTYLVDLTGTGTSDKIAVQATTFNGTTPTNGIANLGGRLTFSYTNSLRANQTYTILTAEGGRTGTFLEPAALTAILTPVVTYTANAVQVSVQAGSYGSAINQSSPTQKAFASLLDQNRANASQYDAIYGPLDLASTATIQSTLEGLAPTTETTLRGLGTAMVDTASGMMRDRVQSLDIATVGGTVAHIGQPIRVASSAIAESSNLVSPRMIGGNEQATVQEGALPENMSAFFAGGYIDGDSAAMPAAISTARDNFDGWYVAAGMETLIDSESAIGFAMSYSKMDSAGAVAAHSAKAELIQGTLYGKYEAASGLTLDSQISAGVLATRSERSVAFVGTSYTLSSKDHALAFSSEAGLAYALDLTDISVTPRVAWRTSYVDYSRTIETGGPLAMAYNRQPVNSSQVRGGLTLAGTGGMKVKPFVSGTYVYDFGDHPAAFSANFVGSSTPGALFQLSAQDRDWGEVAAGLTVKGKAIDLSVAGEMTVGRTDVVTRSVRGSLSFHF